LNSRRLRVIYCTRGGFFGALVLRRLQACEQIEICGIVRSSRMFHARFGFLRGALAYIQRSGLAYSLYLLSATSLADVLCRFGATGCVPTRTRSGGIPVHTTCDINDAASLQFLRVCTPDLLVSAFFDQRLQEAALALPPRGCVNIHPSLLPSFKGVDPVLQARVQRADRLGVTVHRMVPALDAGEILAQRPVDLPERASVFAGTASLFREGAELLVSQIEERALAGPGTPQQTTGSYQSWPTRAELRELRSLGGSLMRLADFREMRA
jgi:methionyl-tRNA formyltransferase